MKTIVNNVPEKVKDFVEVLTKVPAKGFPPIIQSNQNSTERDGNVWILNFRLKPKTEVNIRMIYPWIPKKYRCQDVGFMDGIFTVSITPKYLN